jgi:TNF receptor-associated factor 3
MKFSNIYLEQSIYKEKLILKYIMSNCYTRILELEQFPKETHSQIREYTCPLCGGLYLDPVVDLCGHVFCKECINLCICNTKICPINKTPALANNLHPIPFITNILNKQEIKCKHLCGWLGKSSEFKEHLLEECVKAPAKCKNLGCNIMITRSEGDEHELNCLYRLYKCIHCALELPLIDTTKHEELCPSMIVKCPQKCDYETERSRINQHIEKDCINTKLQCAYAKLGCDELILRQDLTKHQDELKETHNKKLVDYVVNLGNKFNKFKKKQEDILNNVKAKVVEEVMNLLTDRGSLGKSKINS